MCPGQGEPGAEMIKVALFLCGRHCVNPKHSDGQDDDQITNYFLNKDHLFIQDDAFKRLHDMTPVAQITELAVMHIILLMTRHAIGIQKDLLVHRRLVARFTFKPRMTALQPVLRLGVMVELP